MSPSGSPSRVLLGLGLALGTAVFFGSGSQGAAAPTPLSFALGAGYPTNSSFNVPYYQAVGDFNNDGAPDVVVTDGSQPTILRLLIGTGAGGFNSPINLNVSGPCPGPSCSLNTNRVLAVDVNGDGNLDIVTSNNHSRNLSVILGNGNGTFQTANNYAMGWDTRAVAVGDLNNDGKLDLIGGDSNSDIRVFIGNGNGTFGAGVSYPDGGICRTGMAVADLDADGNNDVLVGNACTADFSVLRGHGNGTLTPWVRYSGARGDTFVVKDLDGDGWLDVAAPSNSLAHVMVFLGTGGGNLGTPTPYATSGSFSLNIAAADLDSDGNADIVVSNQNNHTVSILQGNGAGGFGSPMDLPSPVNTSLLFGVGQPATGDFDGDGRTDISVVSFNNDNVVVFLNNTVPPSCAPGSYLSGSTCVLAPAGTYSPGGAVTAPISCAAGTFSSTVGAAACTPAPAGTFVPGAGATSATPCPSGYWSNGGATACYVVDSDGDGVNDVDDAYPNSNMSATVQLGACTTGVANRRLPNGATFNDLLASAVSGAANHGARVSAVTQLANGWKAGGLISGSDHGAIVSCVARAK